jgi:hypothetical protein
MQDKAKTYAQWLVQNKDKRGTSEFDTVSRAYKSLRAQSLGGSMDSDGVLNAGTVTGGDGRQYTPEQIEMAKRFREQGGVDSQMDAFAERNPVASKAATFLKGVPFVGEYFDEAAGAVSPNPNATELVRAMQAREERENPGTATALQLAGGVVGSVPLAAAAGPAMMARAPVSMAGKLGAGAITGAVAGGVEGAVSGYGAGTNPQSRADEAKWRGAVGTGLGAILGGGAPFVARAGEGAANLASQARDYVTGRSVPGISRPAASVLQRAVAGDGQQYARNMANLSRGGSDAMLADASQGTRDLLDASIAKSGPAANIAKQRVEERAGRANQGFRAALDQAFGLPQGVKRTETAIRQGSAPARKAAYDAAYRAPIDWDSTQGFVLEDLIDRVPPQAFAVANKLMRVEGEKPAYMFKRQYMVGGGNGRKVESKILPDVRQLDYLTRALNEVADQADAKGKLGGTTQLGRAYGGLSKDIRTLLRDMVGEYDNALQTAADPISQRMALRQGQKFLSPSIPRDEAADIVRGMTGPEMAALKQGIRSTIDESMANVKRIVSDSNIDARQALQAVKDLSSDASREKISLVLSPQEQQMFFREFDRNLLGLELRAAVSANSKTAIRTVTDRLVSQTAQGGAIRQGASGQPVMSVKRIVQSLTRNTPEDMAAREDELYAEIVNVLTSTTGNDAKAMLRTLANINLRQPVSVADAKRVGQILAGSTALPAYQYGTQELTR